MGITIGAGRFTNSGTLRGGLSMSDGSNYLDNSKGLIYGGIQMLGGNDTVLGGRLGEVIDGGTGNDRINGGRGNDKIIGGEGYDNLTGGEGNDLFVFAAAPLATNADTIRDFASADDTIQLRLNYFAGFAGRGKLSSDALHFGSAAADAEDRIIYHKATGALYYDSDGTGAAAQVKIATLSNKAKLVLADFVIT